jgi:NAD(P)-dependent dehydrogenase (short-subunit alcohol dehydrogenase family)
MAPRTWLVTGCSSGFGRLFIPAILARGDRVIATARDTSSLVHLNAERDARIIQLDVTAPKEVLDQKLHEAIGLFGQIDVLVNNAGYVASGVWEEVR